jgi:hypothetical protein
MIIAMWVYFWVFYSIPSVCMSVFVPVPWCFCYCGSTIYFEVRYYTSGITFFFFWLRMALSFWSLSCFPMNLKLILWRIALEFYSNCIESVDCFQYYNHSYNVNSACEHGRSFHFLVSSVSFFGVL